MVSKGKPLLPRVRLAVAADMLGVPFPGLFSALCRAGLADLVDDFLCVPSVLVELLLPWSAADLAEVS